ncbi:LysE family transporter [Sneathiella marina]|uniref:LysE family transporter n=1 Tax=Sneathiella marina TaxID=2950108 RepID=A0ABY4W447_9PROT|nr:LysE family transporter [Sneathiella marina]USG61963.1 LysE family transporter [Sneathiella marina]
MSIEIWIVYLLATAALSLTPGPNSLLILSHGATYGVRKSLFTSLGGAIGFALIIGICMAGLGALLATSTLAFNIVKWVGAGYLIYLGIVTWRAPPLSAQPEFRTGSANRYKLFIQGFMAAASNPKGIIFFAAFLPQFVDPNGSQILQFFVLAGTFVCFEFILEIILAVSASKLAPWLAKSKVGRWFNRITGASFIAVGSLLASAEK